MKNANVIWDTCVWIDYFRNKNFKYSENLEFLIFDGKLNTCGVIIAELISGTRSKKEANIIEQTLCSLEVVELNYKTYIHAGFMRGNMLKKGITLPLTDTIIACACIISGCYLLSYDKHFQQIAKHYPLKLIS